MLIRIIFATCVLFAFNLNANDVEEGKKIFMTKKIGNCLACHDVNGENVPQAGALGPKLMALKHWPKETLYKKVFDATVDNPISAMPPFGANKVLTNEQIHKVVAYLKTIE
jgi:sulfur-oxidizing protein SoxX